MRPLLLALILVVCVSFLSKEACAVAPRVVSVKGVVSDAVTGKPIAGAIIGVYESGRETVKTDSRGRFKVLAVPGAKRIIYYDGGNPLYRSTGNTYTTVDVLSKGVSGVIFELLKVQFGHGKVFDPSGMPLVGANVTVCGSGFVSAVTDAKGKFKVMLPDDQAAPGG